MTAAFETWYESLSNGFHLGSEEEQEIMKTWLWLAWRDSRRALVKTIDEMPRHE